MEIILDYPIGLNVIACALKSRRGRQNGQSREMAKEKGRRNEAEMKIRFKA